MQDLYLDGEYRAALKEVFPYALSIFFVIFTFRNLDFIPKTVLSCLDPRMLLYVNFIVIKLF